MSDVVMFPKGRQPGSIVITISGYWNGPLYYFEVTSSATPADDDPRIAVTNNFDAAVRAAFEHAQAIGPDSVRFVLTAEDMYGGAG